MAKDTHTVAGIEFCDIDVDYGTGAPRFVDAYAGRASVVEKDGSIREATDGELETLNEDDMLIHELANKGWY